MVANNHLIFQISYYVHTRTQNKECRKAYLYNITVHTYTVSLLFWSQPQKVNSQNINVYADILPSSCDSTWLPALQESLFYRKACLPFSHLLGKVQQRRYKTNAVSPAGLTKEMYSLQQASSVNNTYLVCQVTAHTQWASRAQQSLHQLANPILFLFILLLS